jgi:hypothetical protein
MTEPKGKTLTDVLKSCKDDGFCIDSCGYHTKVVPFTHVAKNSLIGGATINCSASGKAKYGCVYVYQTGNGDNFESHNIDIAKTIERQLSSAYCRGEKLTMADICASLRLARRVSVSITYE